MNFQQFAETHGLIITHLVTDKWVRVPTVDKPHSKNGAYIYDGQSGAIQNWAIHDKPVSWKSKEPYRPDPLAKEKREKAERERIDRQAKASKKAGWIMSQAKEGTHPYLARKGFPTQKCYIWNELLVLPTREGDKLVGCQLISADGTKKFLTGQKTKGVSLVMDNKGVDIVCEGFATAMSVRRAMKYLKQRYKIHVCFSASNMVDIGMKLKNPIVIADNDPMGIRTAKKIASDYWVAKAEGQDFNDAEIALGTEAVAQSLAPFIHSRAGRQ
jgi:putative DNA primase/helicase